MPDPTHDPNWPEVRRLALIALTVGLALSVIKFTAFWLTDSAAVLSDALESVINVVAAGAMLWTLWLSSRPADENHPYGHGKAEFMAAAFEGALIGFAGLLIATEAVRRFIDPPALTRLAEGAALLAVTGVINGVLAAMLLRAGRRLRSPALRADGHHLMTDLVTTIAVVGGLLLVWATGVYWLDPAFALVFAVIIVVSGWRLISASIGGLMDAADPDDERAVLAILDDEVRAGAIAGHHKVRVRSNGPFRWVDMHLQVDPTLTVAESHDIASRIEGRIERAFGRANATAHVEPAEGDA
jgi:cation diffusion facilitator family transporter